MNSDFPCKFSKTHRILAKGDILKGKNFNVEILEFDESTLELKKIMNENDADFETESLLDEFCRITRQKKLVTKAELQANIVKMFEDKVFDINQEFEANKPVNKSCALYIVVPE